MSSTAVIVTCALVLSGCAGRAGDGPSDTTAATSISSNSSATATTAVIAGDHTLCTSLLDAETVAAYQANGWHEWGADYERKIVAESGSDSHSVARFVGYGGVLCAWGTDDDGVEVFAYGPLTEDEAAIERANIAEQGSARVESSAYERYTEPQGWPGGYAFGNGYWAYSAGNGGGDVLDEIVGNAPAF
ncbi:MAG: hypothetical protein QM635_01365 [Microbacteriaceae bacterium]